MKSLMFYTQRDSISVSSPRDGAGPAEQSSVSPSGSRLPPGTSSWPPAVATTRRGHHLQLLRLQALIWESFWKTQKAEKGVSLTKGGPAGGRGGSPGALRPSGFSRAPAPRGAPEGGTGWGEGRALG